MATKSWRKEARVLEAAYDLEPCDEVWALRVLVELTHTTGGLAAATAHLIRSGEPRLVASLGDAALIAELPLSIHLPVNATCAWLFSLAVHCETKLAARESLHRIIPHLRTAAALREDGRSEVSAAVLRDGGSGQGLARRGEEVASAWRDLLSGRLSRVAMLRGAGATQVIAVRCEQGADPRALTARELQVAVRCALGEANKSIAIDLGLSPVTVSGELGSAMDKLGLISRAELVTWFGEQRQRARVVPVARAS